MNVGRGTAGDESSAPGGSKDNAALTPEVAAREPWRAYERAVELLPNQPAEARRWLELADRAFRSKDDALGRHSVAAATLILIASRHADYRGLAACIERFRAPVDRSEANAQLALRTQIASICLPTLDPGVRFDDADVAAAARNVFETLRDAAELPADERLLYGKLLLDYFNLNQDFDRFRHVAAFLHPTVEDPGASPFWVGVWWWRLATTYAKCGDAGAAATSREHAWELARRGELAELEYALAAEELSALLQQDDLERAGRLVERMKALAPAVNPTWQGHGLVSQARYGLLRGRALDARECCERALAIYADTEISERERDMCRSVLAQTHVALGEEQRALDLLEQCRPHQTGGQQAMLDSLVLATRAAQALRTGDPPLEPALRACLAAARAIKWHNLFFTLPAIAAALFDAALARDIEPEFVAEAVRKRNIAAPDTAREQWPWRLRIHALGRFSVTRDDLPLTFEGKAQKRPLDLLKALIALGGQAVPRETLIGALWPDPDADGGKNFDVTLSRLRKLLEVDGALLLTEGKLSLNRRLAWCDVDAFELRFSELNAALHADDAARIGRAGAELFRLYRDKLFGDEPAAAWSVAARERLALKFNRAVAEIGAWLERQGRWREAIDRYERGLAQQMLAEPLYRGLMRCHAALGETVEALLAYRRCRELLSIVLSIAPSAETEALHRQLRDA